MTLSRRAFLHGGLSGIGLLGAASLGACGRRPAVLPEDAPLVDFHVHLFGVGDGGTGCFLSEEQRAHPNFAFLLRLFELREDGDLDRAYVERLARQVQGSRIDRVLLFAQDARYGADGRRGADTHVYVPNEWLFEVVATHPDLFVPCASIHPRRPDALEELAKCAERGARAVKVHPPIQDVDPAEPALIPFWERLADLGILLIVHTGTEHSSPVVGFEFCDPARLENALQAGCRVVAAHSGFGDFTDRVDYFDSMLAMVRRFPELYCDTAILGSMLRWRNLQRLLETPEVLARAVHASDFPFPSNPLVSWNRLPPGTLAALLEEDNLLDRDLELKRALGFPADYFTRGAELLGMR